MSTITEDQFFDDFGLIDIDDAEPAVLNQLEALLSQSEGEFHHNGHRAETLNVDNGLGIKSLLFVGGIIDGPTFLKMDFLKENINLIKTEADRIASHIWTLVDADGDIYASPGFRLVNRMDMVVTEKPWIDEVNDAEYYMMESEDDLNADPVNLPNP